MFSRALVTIWAAGFLGTAPAHERAAFWIDMALGEPVSSEVMLEDLVEVDVVYLGETHRLERHHRLQAELVRGLAGSGRPLILGMEQIEARDQEKVDAFNAGTLDFDGLAEAIKWNEQWNNYADYRGIIEVVRKANGRVVGLNGPREVIRSVGRKGIAGLSQEERAQLPENIFLEDPVYEKLMKTLLLVHMTMEKGFLRNVYEAQAARDESMAAALEKAWLGAAETADRRKPIAIVICGTGHCQFGLGTPDRVRRRLKGTHDRIVLMSESGDLELTKAEKAMKRDIVIRHRDLKFIRRPLADYLHAMEPKPEEAGTR
jgi:uncharacterized iron-regulated protein